MTKVGNLAAQAENQYVSSAVESLCRYSGVGEPGLQEALSVWSELSKLGEPVAKVVPNTMAAEYPAVRGLRQALARLEDHILIAGKAAVASLVEKHGVGKCGDEMHKLFASSLLPPGLTAFVTTIKNACVWSAKTFEIATPKGKDADRTSEELGPHLTLFTKIKGFDLQNLEKVLPEQHALAKEFVNTYEALIKKYIGDVADDLKTSFKYLKELRLGGFPKI